MELRDYVKIIGRHLGVFITVIVLTVVATVIFVKTQPTSYLASTTFTVNKASSLKQKDINYYLFDNYYNVQSAGLFSQIVGTWFESPSLVKEIYQKAGLPVPDVSQRKLAKTFRTDRQEPATINVTITGTDQAELGKLITAAADVLQEKTDELGKSSNETFYEIAKFTPIVSENKVNWPLDMVIALIAGGLIGLIMVFGIEYFKGGKEVN